LEIYILEDNLIQQGRLEMVLSQELKKYNRRMDEKKRFRVIETTAQG